MTTRSSTAPTGGFVPVSVLVSVIVLLATLFVVLQVANLPFFPAANQAPYTTTRAPLFRGLVHLPSFRLPGFGSETTAVPSVDESTMPAEQRINRWEPFIQEASVRYSIPEKWIRTIINIESGGRTMLAGRPITSGAGAMGVMQLMRDTYNEVSQRNGLGSDPHNVHDNILAGTAYLRDLYNRYGYPKLFAAYNAGPGVLEANMFHHRKLPVETQNYLKMAMAGTSDVSLTSGGTAVDTAVKTVVAPKAKVVAATPTKMVKHVAHGTATRKVQVAANASAKHSTAKHSAHHATA